MSETSAKVLLSEEANPCCQRNWHKLLRTIGEAEPPHLWYCKKCGQDYSATVRGEFRVWEPQIWTARF